MVLDVAQIIPAEYLSYLLALSTAFFGLSLLKLGLKIRLIISAILTTALALTPLKSFVISLAHSTGQSLIIISSCLLLMIGTLAGRKGMPTMPSASTASQQSLARLEREKSYLLNQLQKVRGDIRKEQEIIYKISSINSQLRAVRSKKPLPR